MPSIAAGSATPSCRVRIASFNIGQRILLEMKPGESLQDNAVLPIFSAAPTTAELVASLVWSPLIISTSFIIGTGFMKCIPMTLSGRLVALAIVDIDFSEEGTEIIVEGPNDNYLAKVVKLPWFNADKETHLD